MIWNAAIYRTRVMRNIVFVEVRLTLVYRLWQKRGYASRPFSVGRANVLCLKFPGLNFDISTLQFIRLGNQSKQLTWKIRALR
jgi:hypothetical protein